MNTELIKREFESYRKDDAEAQALLDRAADENRALNPEEEEQFDKLFQSARGHKTRSDKLATMEDDGETLRALVEARIGNTTSLDSGSADGGVESFDTRLIAAIAESKADYHRTNSSRDFIVEGYANLEKRAIADFSDNGALYTTDFATKVAVYQRTASPWINLASIINADNGRPLNLPNLTTDASVVSPGEGTAITESTPTVGSAALTTTAYKGLSYISAEAEEDELIGLLDYIARSQGRQIGLTFGSALTGTLLSAMNNGGTALGQGGLGVSTATFFGYEDLISLKYSRQAPYRASGVFVAANAAIQKIRKWRDSNGAYFFAAASHPQMADSFDGNAIYEDPYLAAPASATKSVVFGDASAILIKQMALRVATSTEFRFSNDQVALKTVYRAGGALPDVTALAYLVSSNT